MLRRMLFVLAACCFTALLAVAADKRANDDLQGVWQAVGAEVGGNKSPAEQVEELKVVIQADHLTIKPDSEGRKTTFKLDPSRTPKTIDLTPLDGDRKGTIVRGIYSFQDGQLRLCINIWGKDPAQRPTGFKTQVGDGFVLVNLKRVKRE